MSKYTEPRPAISALISIDVQNDFTLADAPAQISGTQERLPQIRELLRAFRAAGCPIVHVVRLYLPDGSNVDACRREFIEQGLRIAAPGTPGAELAEALKPGPTVRLDAESLLRGQFQPLGEGEWAMYKPRWDAFYQTGLESHLRKLGVDTLVFCGCNFPNCPRASVYSASMRDFRVVLVHDAVSGVYERGLSELKNIGVVAMTTAECVEWITQAAPVTAGSGRG